MRIRVSEKEEITGGQLIQPVQCFIFAAPILQPNKAEACIGNTLQNLVGSIVRSVRGYQHL